jgi:hypothetical protein
VDLGFVTRLVQLGYGFDGLETCNIALALALGNKATPQVWQLLLDNGAAFGLHQDWDLAIGSALNEVNSLRRVIDKYKDYIEPD